MTAAPSATSAGRTLSSTLLQLLRRYWAVLLLVAIWEAWVVFNQFNAIVMPRPLGVLAELGRSWREFAGAAVLTLSLAVAGLACGMLLGIGLALAGWSSRIAGGLLTPIAIIFSSVPVVALIPVFARLFGYGTPTVLFAVTIITFFPSFVYTSAGLRATPSGSDDLLQVFGARRWQRLTVLAFPSAMPHIAVALRLAAAHSVLAAVVAEFLMGTSGLGYLFRQSIVDMRTEFAFGCSVVATVISVAMFLAAGAAEKAIRDRWT